MSLVSSFLRVNIPQHKNHKLLTHKTEKQLFEQFQVACFDSMCVYILYSQNENKDIIALYRARLVHNKQSRERAPRYF